MIGGLGTRGLVLTLLHPSLDGSCRCVCHLSGAVSSASGSGSKLEDGTFTERPPWHHHIEEQSLMYVVK